MDDIQFSGDAEQLFDDYDEEDEDEEEDELKKKKDADDAEDEPDTGLPTPEDDEL
jgi:hypothetical protein